MSVVTVGDIYRAVDGIAPFKLQADFDNAGLLIGGESESCGVTKVIISLDVTEEAVREAEAKGAELLVTHHPVIFHPLKKIRGDSYVHRLCKNNTSVISAHTNADVCFMSDLLIKRLGLPPSDEILERIGESGLGYGKIVTIPRKTRAEELAELVKRRLGCNALFYTDGGLSVSRVALCPGAADLESILAKNSDLDCGAFVVGECKHSAYIAAEENRRTLIVAGHFYTENVFCAHLQSLLSEKFPQVNFEVVSNTPVKAFF